MLHIQNLVDNWFCTLQHKAMPQYSRPGVHGASGGHSLHRQKEGVRLILNLTAAHCPPGGCPAAVPSSQVFPKWLCLPKPWQLPEPPTADEKLMRSMQLGKTTSNQYSNMEQWHRGIHTACDNITATFHFVLFHFNEKVRPFYGPSVSFCFIPCLAQF